MADRYPIVISESIIPEHREYHRFANAVHDYLAALSDALSDGEFELPDLSDYIVKE